jgi:hypothetical protein
MGPRATWTAQNEQMPYLRTLSGLGAGVVALALAACVTPPTPGSTSADVARQWGRPTATYALDAGAQRLEYASGPFGRTTWMVDVDATGRVTQARQVLNEAEFFRLQAQTGLTRDALLRWIGTPGERRGARGGGETWSWRYPTNDCLWFQASLDASGLVLAAAFGTDPLCDAPSDARE